MATIIIDGVPTSLPAGMTEEGFREYQKNLQPVTSQGEQGSSSSTSFNPAPLPEGQFFTGSIDPASIKALPDAMDAAKIWYKFNYGQDFAGTPDELADYAKRQSYWLGTNTPKLAFDAARVNKSADPNVAKAMLYLNDLYSELQWDTEGALLFAKGQVTDPLNWVGLETFGIGLAGKQAAKDVAVTGLKSWLKDNVVRPAVPLAVEAGAVGAIQSSSLQSANITAGNQQEFSFGQLAKDTGVTAVLGAGLGGLVGAGVTLAKGARKDASKLADSIVKDEAQVEAPKVETSKVMEAPAIVPKADTIDTWISRFSPNNPQVAERQAAKVLEAEAVHARLNAPRDVLNINGERDVIDIYGKSLMSEGARNAVDHVRTLLDKHDGNVVEGFMKTIADAADGNGWTIAPGGRYAIDARFKEATDFVSKLSAKDLDQITQVLDSLGMTAAQRVGLQNAISNAANKATVTLTNLGAKYMTASGAEKAALKKLIDEYKPVQDKLARLYLPSSSNTGQALVMNKENMLAGTSRDRVSPDYILEKSGINPLTATAAEHDAAFADWVKHMVDNRVAYANRKEVRDITEKMEEAFHNKDMKTVEQLRGQRKRLMDKMAEEDAIKQGVSYENWNKFERLVNEYVISAVFTPSTALINTLPSVMKTLYKPLINYLSDQTGTATARGMLAQYSAMFSVANAAKQVAKATFTYEQAMRSGSVSKWLERDPSIPGKLGRVIRVIPRLLQSTDEFFFTVNYHGFVVGEAVNDAIAKMTQDGVRKNSKLWNDGIEKAIKTATDNAYAPSGQIADIIEFLYKQADRRGLSGDAATRFVQAEMNKNADVFKQAINVRGKSYTDDLLFRREFTGEGTASGFAKSYEQFMNSHPLMRVMFQLFIRTPIRVFEEGVRLTPGLNLGAPKFIDDLKGINGTVRQARAYGEAYMSLAFAAATMSLYANGMITGSGSGDYRQTRDRQGANWQPYTIYFGNNGGSISIRNFDPFSINMKIMVNIMDAMQVALYRQQQGDYVDGTIEQYGSMLASVAYAAMSVVKDSGMTDGINQLDGLVTDLLNPEARADSIKKFFGQKIQLAVPNILGKSQTFMADLSGQAVPVKTPSGVSQMLEQRINPMSDSISTMRDPLGNKMYVGNPSAAYFGLGVNNGLYSNLSKKAQEVRVLLADIDIAAGGNFNFKTTSTLLPGVDLRTKRTNGKTWYDQIADIYQKTGVTDALYDKLIANPDLTSWGTTDAQRKGTKKSIATDTINAYWNASVQAFINNNPEAMKLYQQSLQNQQASKAGMFNVAPPSFSVGN